MSGSHRSRLEHTVGRFVYERPRRGGVMIDSALRIDGAFRGMTGGAKDGLGGGSRE